MWDLMLQLKNAFPSYLEDEIHAILQKTNAKQMPADYSVKTFPVFVAREKIEIPQRHALNQIQASNFFERIISKKNILTEIQYHIIDCFYTRHCDRFIREQHLNKIILLNQEWVVPYVIQLVGEYVIEILNIIYKNLNSLDLLLYKNFFDQNPIFYKLIKDRVQSYWNEYYRTTCSSSNIARYTKEDYVGFKILDIFEA